MNFRNLSLLLCLFASPVVVFAQEPERRVDLNIRAGFSIGASAPMNMPVTIRKIESYNPGLGLSLEAGAHYHINTQWGLATAVRFEQKGMTTNARVKGYYTTFNEGGAGSSQSITGYFTGSVQTKVKNDYLTIPLHLTYSFNSPLTLKLGGYASYLLENSFTGKASDGYIRDQTPTGVKEEINEASYNFSSEARKFNAGLEIAADYKVKSHFYISGNFSYALTPLMKPEFKSVDFDLHNLFLNLGVGYRF